MPSSVSPGRSGPTDAAAAVEERIDHLARDLARLTEEVTRLRHRLDTLTTLERYRDVTLSRFPTHSLNLPGLCRLDARDFLDLVDGVHSLEYTASGRAYRWTGPGHFTRFSFLVDRSMPLRVRISALPSGVPEHRRHDQRRGRGRGLSDITGGVTATISSPVLCRGAMAARPLRCCCTCPCCSARAISASRMTAGSGSAFAASAWSRRGEPVSLGRASSTARRWRSPRRSAPTSGTICCPTRSHRC